MAINAGMKWEIRNGGDDTNNGGGFRGGSIKAAPSAPTLATAATGGTVANNTYKVVVTITDGNGETSKSAEASIVTTGTNISTITVTAPTNPNDTGATWNVYCGTAAGGPYFSQGTGLLFTANRVITSTPPTSGTQPPGTDRSQQTGAQVNIENSAITASTPGANSNVLTFLGGYVPTAADVGNCVQMTGGTNITAGVYEITAWSATTWTVTGAGNLTGAGGAGASLLGKMGGAFASVGKATGFAVASNDIYVQYNATPYAMSSSANVAGGKVTLGAVSGQSIIGYSTTRTRDNTDALRPTFQAGADTFTMFAMSSGTNAVLSNVIIDGNSHASIVGVTGSGVIRNVKFIGMTTGVTVSNANVVDCYATGCATSFTLSGGVTAGCVSAAHTVTGFSLGVSSPRAVRCIAEATTSASATGFLLSTNSFIEQCIAYGHTGAGGAGIKWSGTGAGVAFNCVAYGNESNYVGNSPAIPGTQLFGCAGGGSTLAGGAELVNLFSTQCHGQITLTADPFTSAAGHDYSLNTTTGGGPLLKATGWPSSFAGISTNTTPDVGAAQSSGVNSGDTNPGISNVKSGTAYTFGGSSLTGTLVVPATPAGSLRGGFCNG